MYLCGYYFAVHIVTFTNNMHLQCLKWTVAKCDKHLIRATKSCSKLGSHWPNKNVWATIMPFGPVTLIFYWPKKNLFGWPSFQALIYHIVTLAENCMFESFLGVSHFYIFTSHISRYLTYRLHRAILIFFAIKFVFVKIFHVFSSKNFKWCIW